MSDTAPSRPATMATPGATRTAAATSVRTGARSALALALFIGVAAVGAAIGSALSGPGIDGWYAETATPMWTPPNAVFGPVWAVLYTAMSVAAWLVWRRPDSDGRSRALRVYAGQLALNLAWSPVFFGLGGVLGAPGLWLALGIIVALDVAILAAIIRFGDVSRLAASLLVPYWFWALFATTLNAAIAVLAG